MTKPSQAHFNGYGYSPTHAGPKIPPRGGSALPASPQAATAPAPASAPKK